MIAGSVAVVTGATRGLGRSIALELARRGAAVVAVGRSTEAKPNRVMAGTLERVQAELDAIGKRSLTVQADINDLSQVDVVVGRVLEWAGRCDVLINNASYTPAGGFFDVSTSKWTTGMGITVLAPVRLCQGLLPGMLERGEGRVLNIGSESGACIDAASADHGRYEVAGTPLMYCVTKAALERLTVGLHDEFGSRGVAFNNLRAGQMSTDGWHLMRAATGFDDPVETVHTPEEAARAVCWMLEQPTSFSGQILDFAQLVSRGVLPER
jgi:NAD(P)-dependent dehydrogenase (short-subunit alcohol dehydrogenase family)